MRRCHDHKLCRFLQIPDRGLWCRHSAWGRLLLRSLFPHFVRHIGRRHQGRLRAHPHRRALADIRSRRRRHRGGTCQGHNRHLAQVLWCRSSEVPHPSLRAPVCPNLFEPTGFEPARFAMGHANVYARFGLMAGGARPSWSHSAVCHHVHVDCRIPQSTSARKIGHSR